MRKGALLAEGKTKRIWEDLESPPHTGWVIIEAKDDLTAGNGKKHDIVVGKGVLANATTCNVFRFLQSTLHGRFLGLAFREQIDELCFRARWCDMLPYEVVVRGEVHGSILKRRPDLQKGHVFDNPLVEFFLKTSGRKWKNHDLPCDDPLIRFDREFRRADLYVPDQPMNDQVPFLVLNEFPMQGTNAFTLMANTACETFDLLREGWRKLGRNLVDFKVEFGSHSGELLLADVIDNDSWRVLQNGEYIDKQSYRDGEDLNEVTRKYRLVAELTGKFA